MVDYCDVVIIIVIVVDRDFEVNVVISYWFNLIEIDFLF